MKKTPLTKLLNIGLWANIAEWYEFLVYVHLSSIIAQLFFSSEVTPRVGLIQTFALLALSYFVRPLGSLFFGYFAEKRGRKAALSLSLMMMSAPTILIGLLPTYASIGYVATLLLLILRLIQGFAAGGESPITYCYMFEHAPIKHRSLLLGIASKSSVIGSGLGSLMASLLFLCCDKATILNGAWRIPFLLGIPLTAWIYSVRKHIIEDAPMNVQNNADQSTDHPFKTLFQKERPALLKGLALCNFSSTIGVYLCSIWLPFYLTHFLEIPETVAHPINTGLLFITVPISLTAAWLARKVGALLILRISIVVSLILAYPCFKLMQHGSLSVLILSIFVLKVPLACIGGVIFEVLGSLFKQVRALGMSLSFTLPTAIMGGLTPVLLTSLIHKTGWTLFPAFYCIALGLLALPVALKLKNLSNAVPLSS